jgi:hypothetical protein
LFGGLHERSKNLRGVHHGQPFFEFLYRDDEQSLQTGLAAQGHVFGGFTAKYRIERLVYYETFGDVVKAIAREK